MRWNHDEHGIEAGCIAGEEGEQKAPAHEELTELQRLRAMIDDITEATNLAPVGSTVVNADGAVVGNPLFAGLQYPDKLEAYYHVHQGPKGATSHGVYYLSLIVRRASSWLKSVNEPCRWYYCC